MNSENQEPKQINQLWNQKPENQQTENRETKSSETNQTDSQESVARELMFKILSDVG